MKITKSKTFGIMLILLITIFCAAFLSCFDLTEQGVYAIESFEETAISANSTLSGGGTVADNKKDIGILLDNNNKSNLSSIICIENKNYFLYNPLHAKNDKTYNSYGHCTTVAMQLLMGYHNFYSDRRLIPEIASSGARFLNQNYGNFIYDPLHYNGVPHEGDLGNPGIGTEYAFFKRLIDYTETFNTYSQTIPALAKAANSFVNDYASQIKPNVSIKSNLLFNDEDGRTEIEAGRPIILGYEPVGTGAKNYHVVVAFGYARYNDEFGFLVHSGWSQKLFYWVPASWIGFQIRMSVNHTHSYKVTDKFYSGAYSELVCSECGHRKFDVYYTTDSTGQILTGIKYPLTGDITIPSRINGKYITEIGRGALANKEMSSVSFENDCKITKIGSCAFDSCQNLVRFELPDSVIKIESCAFIRCPKLRMHFKNPSLERISFAAFSETNYPMQQIPASVKTVDNFAFYKCLLDSDFGFAPNSQLQNLTMGAFRNTSLKSLTLPKTITKVIGGISECPMLTFYTDNISTPSNWSKSWYGDRPVVWGCALSEDRSYVVSFTKSATNPSNSSALNGVSKPSRFGYTFGGWYKTADFKGKKYNNMNTMPDGTYYAKWEEGSCVAEGTLITLSDGTQKAVEDLTGSEQLLVWNLFTGTFDTAPILFIDHDPAREYEVINLAFSDETTVKVISEHGFWDFDLNEYVFLRRDAAKYIGHWFNKQTTDAEGKLGWTKVQLVNVKIQKEITTAWSPVTYGHLCYYVNGMLSMPGATEGLINIFDVDPNTLKIDEAKYNADIAEYGLYTYEEFAETYPVPEVIFEAFGGKYLKVSIGKGLIDSETLGRLIERYAKFFA